MPPGAVHVTSRSPGCRPYRPCHRRRDQCAADQVKAAVGLLDEGATVPFIARYRKEVTGGLDDTQLRTLAERLTYLREMEARRAAIADSITSQGKMTDALAASLAKAATKAELEDIYLPYKPKRRTKAEIARERGLQPLPMPSGPTAAPIRRRWQPPTSRTTCRM